MTLVIAGTLGNVVIALAYGIIGAWIVPKFDMAASARGVGLVKLTGTLFFFTCSVTHADMAVHTFWNLPADHLAWHNLLNTLVQAISAPVFAIMTARHLVVRIIDKSQYEQVLDRRLLEMERRREELVHEAVREAGDVTNDVKRAFGGPVTSGETGDH